MSTPLTVGGVTIQFPTQGQNPNWGTQLTQWATLVTANLIPKAGGTFNLTGEVSFGSIAGIKLLYVKSITANPASAGFGRLANTDVIGWRNFANSGDHTLGFNQDSLVMDSSIVAFTNARQSFTSNQAGAVTTLAIVANATTINAGTKNNFFLDITGNVNVSVDNTNVLDGQTMILAMRQTSSFNVTWPGNFNFLTTSTVTTTPGKFVMLTGQFSVALGNIWLVSLINQP